MISLIRTNINHPKFQTLVQKLDSELGSMYGDHMEVFAPHNILKNDTYSLVAIDNDEPVGIGAFRVLENNKEVEIKRMFVLPAHRGKGISKLILKELEQWAIENGHAYAKLETGEKNLTAISLYRNTGYEPIEPFGPYVDIHDSLCFRKKLI